jgi:hypothetical protein
MNEFGCEMCKYKCTKKSNLDVHLSTKKHLELEKKLNSSEGSRPTQKGFYCETCAFRCDKSTYYTRHLNTQKHINKTQNNGSTSTQNCSETTVVSTEMLVQVIQQNNEVLKMLIDDQRQQRELLNVLIDDKRQQRELLNVFLEYYKDSTHNTQ